MCGLRKLGVVDVEQQRLPVAIWIRFRYRLAVRTRLRSLGLRQVDAVVILGRVFVDDRVALVVEALGRSTN